MGHWREKGFEYRPHLNTFCLICNDSGETLDMISERLSIHVSFCVLLKSISFHFTGSRRDAFQPVRLSRGPPLKLTSQYAISKLDMVYSLSTV